MLPRYTARGLRVTVAAAPPGAWCKARAVMPAVARSRATVIAVADADVWTDGLPDAIAAVVDGRAQWAIPHRNVHRLTETATMAVLAGEAWEGQPTCEAPYEGVEGGGIVIASRETLLDVPLDSRYVGWGQEDQSHAFALWALHGDAWRGEAPLLHLYHPPAPRMDRRRGSPESWQLFRRYCKARHDPTVMRALIDEAHADLRLPHPDLPAAAA